MATYQITSPDGQSYKINAPDDATQDQVMAFAQRSFKMAKAADTPKIDPTEGMSAFERGAAGVGKAITDAGQGIGQMLGLVSREDVAEKRKTDAALMKTTAGKVGDFVGNVATTLPLAFVPGANTIKGAALIGSATGLIQPSENTSETLTNTALGGAAGAGGLAIGRGLAAGYQGLTGLIRPITQKGQQEIAAEVLQSSATDAGKAIQSAKNAKSLVAGSMPTLGQVANDPGLAQLERILLNNPETAGPIARRYAEQQAARTKAISDIAGTAEHRAGIEQGRAVFAGEDYGKAFADGIDLEMAKALQPQIDSLMKRPSIQSAKMIAKGLAAENDKSISNFGSIEGMDWLKKALDNQISAAKKPGSSIGDAQLRALVQTKNDLMATLEQIAPAYKVANDNYAAMSKQINASDVAKQLQDTLYKDAQWGGGKEMSQGYKNALAKATESIKKQTGQDRALADVMPTSDIATLEAIAKDLTRKENAQNLGRAVGSPTMQNMLGQTLINRIAGPLGMPQTFSQNVIANSIARPYDFVMKSAQPRIQGLLAEAVADPKKAAELLAIVKQQSKLGLLANKSEKFAPVPGLLAVEDR